MKIIDIYWKRANIYLVLDSKLDNKEIKLNNYDIDINKDTVSFNVTNLPEGNPLNRGKYSLSVDGQKVLVDDKLLSLLDDRSRIFYYERRNEAMLVDFDIEKDSSFVMNVEYVKKKYDVLGYNFKLVTKKILSFFMNLFYRICRLFRVGNNHILFLSENNDYLGDNLSALYEKYKELNEYKLKTYYKDVFHIKSVFHKIIHFIKLVYYVSKSDIIYVDNYVPTLTYIKLSNKTKLVQLWHAGIGFKSVGYARFGLEGSPNPFRSSHRRYDYAIVDDESLVNIYKEVFGAKKEIFRSYGIPRLDGYLDKNKIDSTISNLYDKYEYLKNKKIIMFCPTYRGSGSKDAYYDYSLIDLEKIYNFCKKNNFIFIIKMHSFIREKISIDKKYSDLIKDLSSENINDLIYITDIMISDYSSCAYEYSLFDRPLIFYRFDSAYYEYTRPMHGVDKFTTKQYIVNDFDSLMNTLEKIKNVKVEDRFKNTRKRNTNSCERIIKLLK